MSKLITKARAGVTLVELLVVILIVTILSVSLLPMFKDYIVKSQYAAEAIPVIGNLRTKIGLYQYEYNTLPPNASGEGAEGFNVSTWDFAGATDHERFVHAYYVFGTAEATVDDDGKIDESGKTPLASYSADGVLTMNNGAVHFGSPALLDIDFQDLKGKRSRPFDYFYYQIKCPASTDSAYIVGCFGSGEGGFAPGTGYAVCELNLVSKGVKYIGTFERYKAKEKAEGATTPYLYLAETPGINGDYVFCPQQLTDEYVSPDADKGNVPSIVGLMEDNGWTFTK